jgi:hypothetical protein
LAEEVCEYPLNYEKSGSAEGVELLGKCSMSELVEKLCETHGYRRAFTKKAYWGNRRLELVSHLLKQHPAILQQLEIEDVTRHLATPVFDVIGYCVGIAFGRWDVRYAMSLHRVPDGADTFDPVPVCPPGMLKGDDGLPAIDAPADYPVHIQWDGILVDDSEHSYDIVRRTREALEAICPVGSEVVEREACEMLGVNQLRDYFRKPGKGGFWDDHVSRYSKSRRKAPIYWLLQSAKKSYGLWLYYHRLDKDMLFKALRYVETKVRLEENELDAMRIRKELAGKGTKKLDKGVEQQESLLSELRDFEDKLRRAANLHLEPDLNDGVVLNIAPLWELVPWRDAKDYWEELLAGKYEWSSLGRQLREKGLVK